MGESAWVTGMLVCCLFVCLPGIACNLLTGQENEQLPGAQHISSTVGTVLCGRVLPCGCLGRT